MKKMLKLNELNKKEMVMVRGGDERGCTSGSSTCTCGCQHENNGGSSTSQNLGANRDGKGIDSSNTGGGYIKVPSTNCPK